MRRGQVALGCGLLIYSEDSVFTVQVYSHFPRHCLWQPIIEIGLQERRRKFIKHLYLAWSKSSAAFYRPAFRYAFHAIDNIYIYIYMSQGSTGGTILYCYRVYSIDESQNCRKLYYLQRGMLRYASTMLGKLQDYRDLDARHSGVIACATIFTASSRRLRSSSSRTVLSRDLHLSGWKRR